MDTCKIGSKMCSRLWVQVGKVVFWLVEVFHKAVQLRIRGALNT